MVEYIEDIKIANRVIEKYELYIEQSSVEHKRLSDAYKKLKQEAKEWKIAARSNLQAASMSAMLSDKNKVLELKIKELKENKNKGNYPLKTSRKS